jgi:NAD(P)-dependent dehydrogenase (short-subunit alcohol dehydrogenase family)
MSHAAITSRESIEGRLVFITGAASGIGLGMARAFAAEGARIALADNREASLAAAVEDLRAEGAKVIAAPLDVRDDAQWRGALDNAETHFGSLAILCSNAGVAGSRLALEKTEPAACQWTFDVNVNGALLAIRNGVPRMRAHGLASHIVLTSSMGAFLVRPENGVYSASKAAIIALAEALRGEVQGSALGVSVLCPGLVSTRLIEGNVEQGPSGINLGAHEVELEESMRRAVAPHLVAQAVVRGIYDQRFWLFTHSELKPALDNWLEELRMA